MTRSRIGPTGTARHDTGVGYSPDIGWQIPAIGDRKLTPTEAREFAAWLDSADDPDGWLAFILLDDEPADVAADLRDAADRAEAEVERYEAMSAERKREREAEQ